MGDADLSPWDVARSAAGRCPTRGSISVVRRQRRGRLCSSSSPASAPTRVEHRLRHLADHRLAEVLRAAPERAGRLAPPPRAMTPAEARGSRWSSRGGRGVTFADVDVHEDGRLEVVRVVTGFERGAMVRPVNFRSQVKGGTIRALGGVLSEAIRFENGRILNPKLPEYRGPAVPGRTSHRGPPAGPPGSSLPGWMRDPAHRGGPGDPQRGLQRHGAGPSLAPVGPTGPCVRASDPPGVDDVRSDGPGARRKMAAG